MKINTLVPAVLALLFAVSCYYDATPPLDSELNDIRPRVILRLSGFSPNAPVRIRYWDNQGAAAYPEKFRLFTDLQGGLLVSITAALGTTTLSFLLYVDENKNGVWDIADYGFFQNTLAITGDFTETVVAYSANTLLAYSSLVGAPPSGTNVCIYSPSAMPAWSVSQRKNLPEYPAFDSETLFLDDWFPTGKVEQGGATAPAYLPSGSYNETCIQDANLDNLFTSGESVSGPAPVTVP